LLVVAIFYGPKSKRSDLLRLSLPVAAAADDDDDDDAIAYATRITVFAAAIRRCNITGPIGVMKSR